MRDWLTSFCFALFFLPSLGQLSNSQQKALQKQARGRANFNEYYETLYGTHRWPILSESLLRPTRYAALLNRYIGERNLQLVREHLRAQGAVPFEWNQQQAPGVRPFECFIFPLQQTTSSDIPELSSSTPSPPDSHDTLPSLFTPPVHLVSRFDPSTILCPTDDRIVPLPYYPLDLASVLAVSALRLRPNDHVIDMCAAPGGKSYAITQHLALEERIVYGKKTARLHSNDVSAARRKRLQNVLRNYLPLPISHDSEKIITSQKDLVITQMEYAHYDTVLLDAPCSTDRHTLHSPLELASWSPSRFRRDAERQVALLLQALRTAKPGETIVYATCSLTPTENDEVIQAVAVQCAKWKQKGRTGREGIQIQFEIQPIKLQPSSGASLASPSSSSSFSQSAEPFYMPFGEPTKYGWMILPDQPIRSDVGGMDSNQPHGFGPLYIARLRRCNVDGSTSKEGRVEAT